MRRAGTLAHTLLTTAGILLLLFLTVLSLRASGRIADIEAIPGGSPREIRHYQTVRAASLGTMLLALGGLLWLNRRQQDDRPLSKRAVYEPHSGLQAWLGPAGSLRRRALLTGFPGLGQAAAGRGERAAFIVIAWFVILFGGFLVILDILRRDLAESYFVYPLLPALPTVWTAIFALAVLLATAAAVDALRLNEPERHPGRPLSHDLSRLLSLPLLAAAAGIAAQILIGHWGGEKFPRLAGWGFASAGLFATIAWGFRARARAILALALIGLPAGLLAMYLNILIPVPSNGSLLYRSLINGLLLGSAVYLLFKKRGLSPLAIPAGVAGAWVGNLSAYMVIHTLGASPLNKIFSVTLLRGLTLFEFYFIGLAFLLVAHALRPAGNPDEGQDSCDPMRDGEQGGWPIFDTSSRLVQRMLGKAGRPKPGPADGAAPAPDSHSGPRHF